MQGLGGRRLSPHLPGPRLYGTLQRSSNLCISRKGIARPQSQFPRSCASERSIYSHIRLTYIPAAEQADRSEEYINRSQKHVGTGTLAVQFLS